MPIYLRQSTASQEIPLGYFLSSTDGDTAMTGLTIANTDIKLWVNGATTLANKNSGGATHIANGLYSAVLDATDSATIGPMVVYCKVATALATRTECVVLHANVYDTLFGSTALSTYAGGAVASVTGAVGSVAGNVGGNVVGSVGSVTGAVGSVTGAVGSVTGNVGGNVVGSVASVSGAVGSVTGNVGGDVAGRVLGGGSGTITGDGVRAASVTGAVGSVTGNVGGSVAGSVASVTGNVGGNVLGSVASVVAGVTLTSAYDAAKTALTVSGYTAPDNASIVLTRRAVYDTLTAAGDVLTLSNGATQTIDSDGNRTTAGP